MSDTVNIPGEPPQGATVFPGTGPNNTTAPTPKAAAPVAPAPAEPPVTFQPPDPRTILGNPARMYPASAGYPLNVDLAFLSEIPDEIPYPFAEVAGPYNSAQYAADYQAYLDYTGVITAIQNFITSNNGMTPPPQRCQDIATYSSNAFQYQGKVYVPGKWSPF